MKKSCPFPSATHCAAQLWCAASKWDPATVVQRYNGTTALSTCLGDQVGGRVPTCLVGAERRTQLLGLLVLSPCRWHYSHPKSYVPAHAQSLSPGPRSEAPPSPNPGPVPAHTVVPGQQHQHQQRSANISCRVVTSPKRQDTLAHTLSRNCKSHKQAVKTFICPAASPGQPSSGRPGRHNGTSLEAESRSKERRDASPSSLRIQALCLLRSPRLLSLALSLPPPPLFFNF